MTEELYFISLIKEANVMIVYKQLAYHEKTRKHKRVFLKHVKVKY